MIHAIRTSVAVEADADRQAIQDACFASPTIALTSVMGAGPGTLEALAAQHDDALLVTCAEPSAEILDLVRGALVQRPGRPVVVAYRGEPNGFARRALEAGADDLVALPAEGGSAQALGAQIAFALEKAVVRRGTPTAPGGTADPLVAPGVPAAARITTILGPKGGIGKTVTACNLAVALAKAGRRVVLVDLDLQFGDVGLAMGLAPERTIYDLATAGGSLDADKLDAYLAHHASWARVLPAPTRPDQAGVISPDFLQELFSVLRTCTDHVVVDTPAGFPPEVIAAIDAADDLCVVGSMDALAMKNAKLALETLALMEVPDERIRVVLNRADTRLGLSLDDVHTILGRHADVLVPSSREVVRSINEAVPIASSLRGDVAKAFHALAALYVPAGAGAPAPVITATDLRPGAKIGPISAMLARRRG